MKAALILFGHGARDPEWAVPIRKLQRRVSEQRPDLVVEVAFLELARPLLPEAIEKLASGQCSRIAIVPVFLAQGGHLRNDVPKMLGELRQRFPGISLELWPALGEAEPVLDAIGAWIVNTMPR
jgi:sirohydrochlorin cobaltochelatase